MGVDFTIDFDFDAFEAEVYSAARAKFTSLHREMSGDTFYSFNFCTADVYQHVYIVVFTQNGLENTVRRQGQYHERYRIVAYEELKNYFRFEPESSYFISPGLDTEFARLFEKANDMLMLFHTKISEHFRDPAIDDSEVFDSLYDPMCAQIRSTLKKVLQRLDREGRFESSNGRADIHNGLLHSAPTDDWPGPFYDLNPPESCRRYIAAKVAYREVRKKIWGY